MTGGVGERSSPGTPWVRIALAILVFLGIAGALQLATSAPIDADTAYHLAVARLIREHGILHAFPWTRFSWLSDHYADKELLFHLVMVPFAGFPWITAAKIVGTLSGGALLIVAYLLLRAERTPSAEAWVLAALASSSYFLVRFTLVRPHVLAIALSLTITWAAARRRYVLLAIAGALYPFAYVAWHSALILTIIVEVARALGGRRPDHRPFLVTLAVLAVSVLLHPNFPDLARFAWITNYEILFRTAWSGKAGFAQGTEFQTPDLAGLGRFASLPLAFTLGALFLSWNRRREAVVPLAFALTAGAYGVMFLRSWRFIEYLALFSVTALALSIPPGLERLRRWLPLGVTGLGLVLALTIGREPLSFFRFRTDNIPPETQRALRAAVPVDADVFTCGWGLTGEMMLALPGRRFMVALDPVLFWKQDPKLYSTWFDLVHAPPPLPASYVRDLFGSTYVLCENSREYQPFIGGLSRDPRARLEYRNRVWSLFEIH